MNEFYDLDEDGDGLISYIGHSGLLIPVYLNSLKLKSSASTLNVQVLFLS